MHGSIPFEQCLPSLRLLSAHFLIWCWPNGLWTMCVLPWSLLLPKSPPPSPPLGQGCSGRVLWALSVSWTDLPFLKTFCDPRLILNLLAIVTANHVNLICSWCGGLTSLGYLLCSIQLTYCDPIVHWVLLCSSWFCEKLYPFHLLVPVGCV